MHPIALNLGGFNIYWYGILLALGFVAGGWTASLRAPRSGIASEKIADLLPWLIVGAVVGARLLFVVSYWESFEGKPFWEVFMIRHGGLVYYGGLIGASLVCIVYARVRRLPLWKVADILAPSIALGYVFGRLGCLMNGCCYGRACSMPWAIEFPEGHDMNPVVGDAIPVHPTQIYESLLNLVLYAGLAWLYRRKQCDGQVFAAYLIAYALARFVVESFRGDYNVLYLGGWATPAQLLSILILVSGIALMFLLRRSNRKQAERS